MSAECADLIGRMLTPDPAKRITLRQILRHPWVAAGMPAQLTRLNETLISRVGAVPCDELDPCCCDALGKAVDEDSYTFSALSGSTVGGHSRTSSGGAVQVCIEAPEIKVPALDIVKLAWRLTQRRNCSTLPGVQPCVMFETGGQHGA